MTIEIKDEQVWRLIERETEAGGFASPEEMIAAVVASRQQERESVELAGDFEPGELGRLIAEGEADPETLDGEEAFQARVAARRVRGIEA